MKEGGKPFMTSMTIDTGMFKKFSAELHLPLNRVCCKRAEHTNVRESSQQNTEVIALSHLSLTIILQSSSLCCGVV